MIIHTGGVNTKWVGKRGEDCILAPGPPDCCWRGLYPRPWSPRLLLARIVSSPLVPPIAAGEDCILAPGPPDCCWRGLYPRPWSPRLLLARIVSSPLVPPIAAGEDCILAPGPPDCCWRGLYPRPCVIRREGLMSTSGSDRIT